MQTSKRGRTKTLERALREGKSNKSMGKSWQQLVKQSDLQVPLEESLTRLQRRLISSRSKTRVLCAAEGVEKDMQQYIELR